MNLLAHFRRLALWEKLLTAFGSLASIVGLAYMLLPHPDSATEARETQELKRFESNAISTNTDESREFQYFVHGATATCKTRYIPFLGFKFASKTATAITLMIDNQRADDRVNVEVTLVGIGDVVRANTFSKAVVTNAEGAPLVNIGALARDEVLSFNIRRIPSKESFFLHVLSFDAGKRQPIAIDVRSDGVFARRMDLPDQLVDAFARMTETSLKIAACSTPSPLSL